MKQATERTKTFKSNFEANISNAHGTSSQQLLCFIDPASFEVLMRRRSESSFEKTDEMVRRYARRLRNEFDIQRIAVAIIHQLACPS